MTTADEQDFHDLMQGLGETYGEPVSAMRMELYWRALEDLSIEAVRTAANVHARTSKFFPRPSEIRDLIGGDVNDRAELGWMAVVALVRRYGYPGADGRGKAPEFPDEATRRAALELFGGWASLCQNLPEAGSPAFLGTAKQFKSLYGANVRRDAALPPGETGRELSPEEARAALSHITTELKKRGLPTGAL